MWEVEVESHDNSNGERSGNEDKKKDMMMMKAHHRGRG